MAILKRISASIILLAFVLSGCLGGGGSATRKLTKITITPSSATITKGQTTSFSAFGTYSDNTTSDITKSAIWSSGDLKIATITNSLLGFTSSGIATGLSVGSTSITASLDGMISSSAILTVTAAPLVSVSMTPASATIALGQFTTFSVIGTFSDKSIGNVSGNVTWNSSNSNVATVGNTGIATSSGTGVTTITATASGLTPTTAILTVVNSPPVAVAAITPAIPNPYYLGSGAVTLDGSSSYDPNGNPLTYSWTLTSKPGRSLAALSNPTAAQPNFTPDKYGKYIFTLVVNDGTVNSATATITFTAIYKTPFSTLGADIIDANNQIVELHGVNWAGFESTGSPNGLDSNSVDQILDKIASLGFNMIRLPLSSVFIENTALTPSDPITSVQPYFATSNFPDIIQTNTSRSGLQNPKSSMQILDYVIQRAKAKNLYILLDRHRASRIHQCGHWDTTSLLATYKDINGNYQPCSSDGVTVTEAQWILDWQTLANRYNSPAYDNIVGAEIHNEPSHVVNWGLGDINDWHLAAQKCGTAIQTVHTKWLIFIQGIGGGNAYGNAVPATNPPLIVNIDPGINYWWGGNLRGVAAFPVVLTTPNKVVYAIHEYGPSVYNQHPWFAFGSYTIPNPLPPIATVPFNPLNLATNKATLKTMWDLNWGYIATQKIAPIFFTEFGGKYFDPATLSTTPALPIGQVGGIAIDIPYTEQVWQNYLVDYMVLNGLRYYSYWEIGTYSLDTEGILTNWNGLTVNQAKVNQIINRLMN